jgi:hypothetical protein
MLNFYTDNNIISNLDSLKDLFTLKNLNYFNTKIFQYQ